MVIKEEQVYIEFFDNKNNKIQCFKSNNILYCDKINFEQLFKFLQDNKNNLTDGIMKDMFNQIRNELNNITNEINSYLVRFTTFYSHYTDTKQFSLNNEIVNTLKFSFNYQPLMDKLIEYKIIIIQEIKLENEIIYKLELKCKILENKYNELKKKNLQLESTIEMFKGYYEHKYKSLYDYNKLKEDKKLLHKEFYVVAKLMKLSK